MSESVDKTARRIAEKGRDALLDRLRPAFAEAAAAHADVLELDADKLEEMVQRAADRADGLQWRRALATVATEELGIGLGEALGHPAVVRAQTIVGAPSYEESLAAVADGRAVADGGEGRERETPASDAPASDAPAAAAAGADAGPDANPPVEPSDDEPDSEPSGDDEPDTMNIRIAVLHVNGLSELDGEGELDLLFTEAGVDVVRARGVKARAHFDWSELHDVSIRPGRGGILRRRGTHTRLILTARGRHARFEAPDANAEELQARLAPVLKRLGGDL